jgi:MFS family permease
MLRIPIAALDIPRIVVMLCGMISATHTDNANKTSMSLVPSVAAGWWLLIAASFLMDCCVSMANLSVQYLGIHRLAAPNVVLGLFASVFSCAYAAGCMVSGSLSDRFGRRTLAYAGSFCCLIVWSVLPLLPSWRWVLPTMLFAGAALSLYWPSMQAWLAELSVGRPGGLRRAIGFFNISWCLGLMLGPVLAGLFWPLDFRLGFWAPAGLMVGLAAILYRIPVSGAVHGECPEPAAGMDPGGHPEDTARPEDTLLFMRFAWIGNFSSWFASGALLALFPKLGNQLGFDPQTIGFTVAAFRLGQVGMVFLAMHCGLWQYRLWPLLVVELTAMLTFFLGGIAHSPWAFGVIFAIGGCAAGLTYASSLFYSLAGREGGRGRKTGFHEAILGSGAFLGPLVGGLAAQWFGLRAPFLAAAGICAVAATAQLTLRAVSIRHGRAANASEFSQNRS